MTDKRPGIAPVSMSNGVKKMKTNDTGSNYKENIHDPNKVRTKPTKTTYFFQPTNTLAYRDRDSKEQKDGATNNGTPNVLKESDPNAVSYTIPLVQQIKTPSKTYESYEKFIQEQQSSDDSFEGIRWRTSPRKGICKGVGGMPSSPLKNTVSPKRRGEELKLSSTLVNEQANSVLSKYGAGFHNILSQTPTMNRTHSDISSSESVHKKFINAQQSPSLTRTKSFGIDTLASSKTNKLYRFERPNSKSATPKTTASLSNSTSLNSWIDKFDKSNLKLGSFPCAIDLKTMAPSTNEIINSARHTNNDNEIKQV